VYCRLSTLDFLDYVVNRVWALILDFRKLPELCATSDYYVSVALGLLLPLYYGEVGRGALRTGFKLEQKHTIWELCSKCLAEAEDALARGRGSPAATSGERLGERLGVAFGVARGLAGPSGHPGSPRPPGSPFVGYSPEATRAFYGLLTYALRRESVFPEDFWGEAGFAEGSAVFLGTGLSVCEVLERVSDFNPARVKALIRLLYLGEARAATGSPGGAADTRGSESPAKAPHGGHTSPEARTLAILLLQVLGDVRLAALRSSSIAFNTPSSRPPGKLICDALAIDSSFSLDLFGYLNAALDVYNLAARSKKGVKPVPRLELVPSNGPGGEEVKEWFLGGSSSVLFRDSKLRGLLAPCLMSIDYLSTLGYSDDYESACMQFRADVASLIVAVRPASFGKPWVVPDSISWKYQVYADSASAVKDTRQAPTVLPASEQAECAIDAPDIHQPYDALELFSQQFLLPDTSSDGDSRNLRAPVPQRTGLTDTSVQPENRDIPPPLPQQEVLQKASAASKPAAPTIPASASSKQESDLLTFASPRHSCIAAVTSTPAEKELARSLFFAVHGAEQGASSAPADYALAVLTSHPSELRTELCKEFGVGWFWDLARRASRAGQAEGSSICQELESSISAERDCYSSLQAELDATKRAAAQARQELSDVDHRISELRDQLDHRLGQESSPGQAQSQLQLSSRGQIDLSLIATPRTHTPDFTTSPPFPPPNWGQPASASTDSRVSQDARSAPAFQDRRTPKSAILQTYELEICRIARERISRLSMRQAFDSWLHVAAYQRDIKRILRRVRSLQYIERARREERLEEARMALAEKEVRAREILRAEAEVPLPVPRAAGPSQEPVMPERAPSGQRVARGELERALAQMARMAGIAEM